MDFSFRCQWENSGKEDDDDGALSFSGMIINSSGDGGRSPGSWSSLDFEFSRTSSGATDGGDMDECFPADLFFSNGQLLPHAFPLPANQQYSASGWKDSAASGGSSSRQNSWTTSSSASLDFPDVNTKMAYAKASAKTRGRKRAERAKRRQSTCFVVPRWQFLFPMPSKASISCRGSNPRNSGGRSSRKARSREDEPAGIWTWLMRKIFGAFLSTCRDCHSLQPIIHGEYAVAGN